MPSREQKLSPNVSILLINSRQEKEINGHDLQILYTTHDA